MKNSNKTSAKVWIALVVVAMAVLVAYLVWKSVSPDVGLDSIETTQEAGFDRDVSFRLKWILYSGWAGELLADSKGLWEDEGLEVSMEPGGFELDPIRLVASGADDIGVAGADQILLAREKGIPLVAFAVQYQIIPVGFVSHEGSGITSISDFAGKRVGVKFGTDVEPIYRALLAREEVERSSLTEVPVKFDLSPFFNRQIDVYPGYVTSDLLLPEERGVAVNTIRALENGVRVYGNVYFTTESYLRENPETVRRFFRAVSNGWNEAFTMPAEDVAKLALSYNDSLDSQHEARVFESLKPYVLPNGTVFGSMTEEGWEDAYTMLREHNVLTEDFEWREAFSLSIIDQALAGDSQ